MAPSNMMAQGVWARCRNTMMRCVMRRWVLTCCTLLGAATFAAIGFPVVGSAYAGEPSSQCPLASVSGSSPESASSAQAGAAAMLAGLPLPPGSTESPIDPPEAGPLLARPAYGPPATPNAVNTHGWWVVPVTPAEALGYICAHLPPGTRRTESGGGREGAGVPENLVSGFAWPGSPGVVVVWAARLPNGSTALRADAEVVWVVPRAASERLPAGARLLVISVHRTGQRLVGVKSNRLALLRKLPSRVSSVARIDKIITLLNELRVRQPGSSRLCPMQLAASVKLGFYASQRSSPLAVATVNTAGCGGVSLTIDGRAEPELEGGWRVIEEIGRALETGHSAHH